MTDGAGAMEVHSSLLTQEQGGGNSVMLDIAGHRLRVGIGMESEHQTESKSLPR